MTSSSSRLPVADAAEFVGDPGEDLFDSLLEGGPAGAPVRSGGGSAATDAVLDFIVRRRLDSIAGWAFIVVGAVLISVGYFQVSSTPKVQDQLVFLSAQTAFGMFMTLVGSVLILSRHFQNFSADLRQLRQEHQRATSSHES